ncbi:hypothetical protein LO767_06955 [Halopseudomonas aestusnigri]|uniref:hypothetical protein n=1 Tax=Halopseudomonas TaxID=2901189 RepID=UPI001E3C138D|nr:hypothetical protein [Halopseudomonas aestusnigri]UGV32213.1 hypothetical protein LO767_06955 [Halopseudomonas aestusnigri]|tara:strand:- start:1118 stop:1474 length:357 start_codon:yes stop_codon:yes gene_type:complete
MMKKTALAILVFVFTSTINAYTHAEDLKYIYCIADEINVLTSPPRRYMTDVFFVARDESTSSLESEFVRHLEGQFGISSAQLWSNCPVYYSLDAARRNHRDFASTSKYNVQPSLFVKN